MTEATLSGKHDRAQGVPEDGPELLHTGPIVIRGVGRATRDFFRPDRVNKHRLTRMEVAAAARAAEEDQAETEWFPAVAVEAAIASHVDAVGSGHEEAPGGSRRHEADASAEKAAAAQGWGAFGRSNAIVSGAADLPRRYEHRGAPDRPALTFPSALASADVEALQKSLSIQSAMAEPAMSDHLSLHSGQGPVVADRGAENGLVSAQEDTKGTPSEEPSPPVGSESADVEPEEAPSELSIQQRRNAFEDTVDAGGQVPVATCDEQADVAALGDEGEQAAGGPQPCAPVAAEHVPHVVADDDEQPGGAAVAGQTEPQSESSTSFPPDEEVTLQPHSAPGSREDAATGFDPTERSEIPLPTEAVDEEAAPPGTVQQPTVLSDEPAEAEAGRALTGRDPSPDTEATESVSLEQDEPSGANEDAEQPEGPREKPEAPPKGEDAALPALVLAPAAESDPLTGQDDSGTDAERQSEGPAWIPSEESGMSASEGEPEEPEPSTEHRGDAESWLTALAEPSAEPIEAAREGADQAANAAADESKVGPEPLSRTEAPHEVAPVGSGEATFRDSRREVRADASPSVGQPAGDVARTQPKGAAQGASTSNPESSGGKEGSRGAGAAAESEPLPTLLQEAAVAGVAAGAVASSRAAVSGLDSEDSEAARLPARPHLESVDGRARAISQEAGIEEEAAEWDAHLQSIPAADSGNSSAAEGKPEREVAAALAGALKQEAEPETVNPPRSRPPDIIGARRPARAFRMRRSPREPGVRHPLATGPGGGMGGRRWWTYAVLAVLAVICIVLIVAVVAKARNDAAIAEKEAAAYTPPPLASSSPATTSTLALVSVIGDQYTSGTTADSGTKAEWPALLESAGRADVKTIAAAGAGYVATAAGGATLVSEAGKVDPASTVVVLFGGANDVGASPLALAKEATKAISTARARATKAKIVVVGPASALGTPPQSLLAVRDTLRSAASIGQATWVDPISDKWLSSSAALTNASGQPTDQGQKALESRMEVALKGFL